MSDPALEALKNMASYFHPHFIEPLGASKRYRLYDKKSGQNLKLDFGKLQDSIILAIDQDRDKREGFNFSGKAPDKLFPFLNTEVDGLTAKNDFVVLAYCENRLYVFLIEMKSKSNDGYLKQMQAGRHFFGLVCNLLTLHEKIPNSVNPHYYGVLCFGGRKSPNIGKTRHENTGFNDRNGLWVLDWSESSLNVKSLINAAKRVSC